MSKKTQKPQEPMYTYEENGVTISVYKPNPARPGERTWQGTRGSIWNSGRKSATLNAQGVHHRKMSK